MCNAELPTVGVIIPVLNEAAGIVRCIASVSDEQVIEVIVADGGSTDGTQALAVAEGATVIDTPRGRSRQMNAGAAVVSCDVLLFLHADCTLELRAIRRLRRILAEGRHEAGYFRQKIDGDHPAYRLIEFASNLRARWLMRPYGDQAMFFTREAFKKIGGFPDVPFMEDLLIARRARPLAPWLAMPETVLSSARRWGQDGVVRRMLRNWSVAIGERSGVPLSQLQHRYEEATDRRRKLSSHSEPTGNAVRLEPVVQEVPASRTDCDSGLHAFDERGSIKQPQRGQ